MYNNYLGEGNMVYGMNCILAIACWSGYNQEDGIVMNYDAVHRGMFRSMAFRSYEAFEEDDEKANIQVRFGNPKLIGNWKELRPGLDYSKLDDRGIIKEGAYVDETTVIVGAYMTSTTGGQMKDASTTPQVWTRGRVEKVAIMVNNKGMRLVKIRVVQDRIPELGDKFCLTDDHDVLTNNGWKSIKDVTLEDKVAQRNNKKIEFVHPQEIFDFDHDGAMMLVQTERGTQYVTGDHRLYVLDPNGNTSLIRASELYHTSYRLYSLIDQYEQPSIIHTMYYTESNLIGNKVYCLSVPTEVFLVRRQGEETALWTGNSNRHGQKGTIGALLRGHDMPRTESGIVPDMIMNPHAIPSRMTIAQNLEQLMGKTAALSGTIGDGTSFMNDGSPQESIGGILEELGYEKYGNEVMYNGATGEQIPATIFIGPVYGMRLKHMVEDKWQARGQGRKEARTHQPTGGRGAQGGLKIGEMDRDAIIAHAGMSFVKESFMERSDGTTMPMCVACGTIPIYNPKLNIAICSMCDGPVRYSGDSVSNLEILPPLGRPKSKIVQVEMPYSTKLLTQEQETYLNLSMRYITTSGVQKLTSFESSGATSQMAMELPRLILPPTTAPAYIQPMEEKKFTLEELNSMEASMAEQLNPKLDVIAEENEALMEEPIIQVAAPQLMMTQQQVVQPNAFMVQQMAPQNEVVYPSQLAMPQGMPQGMQQIGGDPTNLGFPMVVQQQAPVFPRITAGGDGVIANPLPGQGGAMLVVDTSGGAMAQMGLDQGGGTRRIRRFQSGGQSSAPTFSSVMPSTVPSSGGSSSGSITITKLE